MLTQTVIDESLNRLSRHFGSYLILRPPASASQLASLEDMVGPLPRDLTILLSTCDGVRINAEGHSELLHIWHVHEMTGDMATPGAAVPMGFLPITGDPTGERDYLILSACVVHGALVRWNHWCDGAELIASSFGHYFDAWSRYLTEQFDAVGRSIDSDRTVAFDSEFVKRWDTALAELQDRRDVKDWLHTLDSAVASGDDFE